MSLAELIINAVAAGRVPGLQFKRGWSNDRETWKGLQVVIGDRLDGARRVAIESELHHAYDTHPVLKTKRENERLRAALERIAGMCDVDGRCPCGRPNGVPAVRHCATSCLSSGDGHGD